MSYLLDMARLALSEIFDDDYEKFHDYSAKDLEQVYMLGYMDAKSKYKDIQTYN